jgi:alanine dehydrogenase
MAALILTREDIEQLLTMKDCIEVIDRAQQEFSAGNVVMPVRLTTSVPDRGNHLAMPALLPGLNAFGIKCITVFPTNPSRGAPTLWGIAILNDPDTGGVLAIMDAAYLTAIRTPAATAVATRALANPEASELAIIGAGVQAGTHLRGIAEVRPIRKVRVAAATRAEAEEYVTRHSPDYPGIEITAVESPEEAIRGADIVCTVSASTEPVTNLDWLKPGCHINGIGSHSPHAREVDGETMAAARVVVDSREATLRECGDCMIPISEGLFGADHVSDEIGEVLAGTKPGRTDPDEITMYQSVGLAIQDIAAAKFVYDRAVEKQIGTRVGL